MERLSPPGRTGWTRPLLLSCCFLSGFSGLVYEVVWMRQLSLVFGSTGLATGAVLAALMGGMGAGSLLFGRGLARWIRPLRIYGLLEWGVGLYALFFPLLLEALVPIYRVIYHGLPGGSAFSLVQFFPTLLLLAPPAVLMGGTLPVLCGGCVRADRAASGSGLLYSLNILGAVVGAAATGYVLLPAVGLKDTTLIAVAVNGLVGGAILWSERTKTGKLPDPVAAESVLELPPRPVAAEYALEPPLRPIPECRWVLIAFALSGWTAMVYEVGWTRALVQVLGASTYAFSAMLAVFLAGLGLGSLVISRSVDRLRNPLWALAGLQVGTGVAALSGQFLFDRFPYFFLLGYARFADSAAGVELVKLLLAALPLFPVALLLGGVFPLVARLYSGVSDKVGRRVGESAKAVVAHHMLETLAAGSVAPPYGVDGG